MIKHLALSLDEDVYGADGDLYDARIREYLIQRIHEYTDHVYATSGMIPVEVVADMIRKYTEEVVRTAELTLSRSKRVS